MTWYVKNGVKRKREKSRELMREGGWSDVNGWHRATRFLTPIFTSIFTALLTMSFTPFALYNGGRFVFSHHARIGALLLALGPVAAARGQDSTRFARALERAERFHAALGPLPQPVAKWLEGDRLAYSPDGKAPWTVIEASTGRVLRSGMDDAAVAGPGADPGPRLGLGYFGPANTKPAKSERWTAQKVNRDIVVSDSAGVTRLTLPGAENQAWSSVAPAAWSRDRRHFVAFRADIREVHRVPIVDYSSAVERVSYVHYTKTGTPFGVRAPHMVDPAAAVARPVQLDARDASIFFLGWRRTVAEALVMRLSRDGKSLDLYAIDTTGAARLLARDARPATVVGALDFHSTGWQWQVTPLPDESGFLWMSERDGWRHVYHYGYDGAVKKQVTSGAFPVDRVVHIDSARRQIYLVASGDSARPYDAQVYRVGLDGTGFTALTSTPGQHEPVFSSSGNFLIDSYSSLTQPPTVELRRADGTLIKRLGQASTAPLAEVGYRPPEPFRVKASDGTTDLHGVLYKPADFDSTKRYPIVDYIYGGPWLAVHQTTYMPSGAAAGMHRIAASLAQMGFIVAMLDARGTPGRSKAFQDANYGRIGQIEIPDHVAALRALARSRAYMDTTRAGIAGHSWGGYFALRGMLTAPDFFKAGYAGAPGDLTESALINEPNMGLLTSNRAGYEAGSNPGHASALRGKLKIMHGTSDTNAPLSTTMRMTEALIDANKTFDLLIMPGQPHGPQGSAGRYYREDVRRFMAIYLIP
jgi:dipeptidyl aminopeptidase/acylaminoacyl peptidase